MTKKALKSLPPQLLNMVNNHRAVAVKPKNTNKKESAPTHALTKLSKHIRDEIDDIGSVKSMISELELIAQILVPMIRSPNDLSGEEVIFQTTFDNAKAAEWLEYVREHYTNVYKIGELIEPICRACLFDSGSYPIAVFPETAITNIIRSGQKENIDLEDIASVEEMSKNFHWFDMEDKQRSEIFKGGVDLESLSIEVSDNPFELFTADLSDIKKRSQSERKMNSFMSSSRLEMESRRERKAAMNGKSVAGGLDEDVEDILFASKSSYSTANELTVEYDIGEDSATGWANTFKLPPTSVIPIVSPNNPEVPLAYYVLLDSSHHPISVRNTKDTYSRMEEQKQLFGEEGLKTLLGSGRTKGSDEVSIDTLYGMYEQEVVSKLRKFVTDGMDDEELEVDAAADISLTLMWRSMTRRKTKIIYVPAEMIDYFTFSVGDKGIGKTMIEDNKIAILQYAMVLIANNMASIQNSTSAKTARIELAKDDGNKDQTVEMVMDRIIRNRSRYEYPNKLNYDSIVDGLHRAKMNVEVVSDDENYPNMNVAVTERDNGHKTIDTEYETRVRNRFAAIWGFAPEMIDITTSVDFSRSVAQSNMITAKKILNWQLKLEPQLTEHTRSHMLASPTMREKLSTLGLSKDLYRKFVRSISITLPRADNTRNEGQLESLQSYSNLIAEAIELTLNRDMLSRDLIEGEGQLESIIAAIKARLIRAYMIKNNIAPEVSAIFADDSDLIKDLTGDFKVLDKLSYKVKATMDKIKERRAKGEVVETPPTAAAVPTDTPVETPEDDAGGVEEAPADSGGANDEGDDAPEFTFKP